MKFLAVAVFLVALACANGSGIGLPLVDGRGALEGALGGQWIPDVPVATPLAASWAGPLAAGPLAAGPLAAGPLAAAWGGAPLAAAWGGAPLAAAWGAPLAARGALEGALGGQWIPDVLPGH